MEARYLVLILWSLMDGFVGILRDYRIDVPLIIYMTFVGSFVAWTVDRRRLYAVLFAASSVAYIACCATGVFQ